MIIQTPRWKELVELLFGEREDVPPDAEIYKESYYRITALESKCVVQSKRLAEALKLKNDALALIEGLRTTNSEICRQNAQHVVNTERLANELADTQGLVKSLRFNEARASQELDEARAQLKKLQPSEPKFRMGQVLALVASDNAFRVRHRRCNLQTGVWEYSNRKPTPNCLEWTAEEKLRGLADAER